MCSQTITIECLNNCPRRLRFKLSSQPPIVMLRGPGSPSNIMTQHYNNNTYEISPLKSWKRKRKTNFDTLHRREKISHGQCSWAFPVLKYELKSLLWKGRLYVWIFNLGNIVRNYLPKPKLRQLVPQKCPKVHSTSRLIGVQCCTLWLHQGTSTRS